MLDLLRYKLHNPFQFILMWLFQSHDLDYEFDSFIWLSRVFLFFINLFPRKILFVILLFFPLFLFSISIVSFSVKFIRDYIL